MKRTGLSKATLYNPLPKDKLSYVTKLIASADNKLYIDKMIISVLEIIENSERKGENADYQHFLLFPQCLPKTSSLGSLNVGGGKDLTLSQMTNFRQSKTESVCR